MDWHSIGKTVLKATIAMMVGGAVAACDGYPRDVEGTTDRVRGESVLHAGIVAGPEEARERALVQAVAKAAGANVEAEADSAEVLLHRLEKSEIDLVVGRFAKATPWKNRVAFTTSPEAKDPPSDEPVLRAAVRSGENRWLIFVTRAVGAG